MVYGPDMSNLTWQNRVRAAREAAGLTREEFAREVDSSTSTIARLELQGHVPNVVTLALIAQFMGITVDDLLNEKAAAS